MHINLALFRLNYLSLLGLGQVIAEREFPFSFFLRQLAHRDIRFGPEISLENHRGKLLLNFSLPAFL